MKCLLAIYMLCANAPVIILDYSDFGPQAMAYELINQHIQDDEMLTTLKETKKKIVESLVRCQYHGKR